jgi:hypothetical protein
VLQIQQRKKLLAATIFSIILVVSLFLVVSLNQTFLFSETITPEEITYDADMGSYSTSLTKDGETLANVYFRIERDFPGQQQYHMLFSITPYSQTKLDSLTLKFSAGTSVLTIYTEATSYVFDDTQFYRRNYETILNIPDTKSFGSSTITLGFILDYCPVNSLSVMAELSMHQQASLQLTSQNAKVYIDANVPNV